jgi:ATP-dependent Zn protease
VTAVDALVAIHESAHAVVACMSGLADVHQVVIHARGAQDEAGRVELHGFALARDRDMPGFLVFLLAGAAAEYKQTGHYSERDGDDVQQATLLASAMHECDVSDPRVGAAVRAAQALANAHMRNEATWAWIERVAKALVNKRRLTGRDVQRLREGRR